MSTQIETWNDKGFENLQAECEGEQTYANNLKRSEMTLNY